MERYKIKITTVPHQNKQYFFNTNLTCGGYHLLIFLLSSDSQCWVLCPFLRRWVSHSLSGTPQKLWSSFPEGVSLFIYLFIYIFGTKNRQHKYVRSFGTWKHKCAYFLAVIVRNFYLYSNKIPNNLNSSLPRAVVIFKMYFQSDPDSICCVAPRVYGKSGKSQMT